MHSYYIYILAAFGCAICNGSTAILQKVSADKEKNANSLDLRLLWRLFHDRPYVIGIFLDILGWLFTIFAVLHLPIFLVQAIIASNIALTALMERFFMHRTMKLKSYFTIAIVLIGLILLGLASSTEKAKPISDLVRWFIVLIPVPVGLAGYLLVRYKNVVANTGIAALSGLAFGGTSIVGRIFSFSHPLWHTIYSPLLLALICSGILGILLFAIALQRAQATSVNATMTVSQTIIPAIIGIVFLGDTARNGMWYLVIIGTLLALGGVLFLSLHSRETNKLAVPSQ